MSVRQMPEIRVVPRLIRPLCSVSAAQGTFFDNRGKSMRPPQARLRVGEILYDPPKNEDKSGM
jgi:hypothetical protein